MPDGAIDYHHSGSCIPIVLRPCSTLDEGSAIAPSSHRSSKHKSLYDKDASPPFAPRRKLTGAVGRWRERIAFFRAWAR